MTTWDDLDKAAGKLETLQDLDEYQKTRERTNYTVSTLGTGTELRNFYTEEERASHWHVFGGTRTGKSKFIELLMRKDIDNGTGAMLLDPSKDASTYTNVLKYALKKNCDDKIIIIDPNDTEATGKVVPVNPLRIRYRRDPKTGAKTTVPDVLSSHSVTSWVEDAFSVTWGTSFNETTRISKFLPAVLKALYAADLTLHEARYFMDNRNKLVADRREFILSHLHHLDLDRQYLEGAFSKNQQEWHGFQPTVNQLNAMNHPTLEAMLGAKDGLNFTKLVTDNWLVLVNLSGEFGKPASQRLLGALLVNELLRSMTRLAHNKWKGRFNLYIDECGTFMNRKVSEILTYDLKLGVSLLLAHQQYKDVGDYESAINTGAHNKVLFRVGDPVDRQKFLRMVYHSGMEKEAEAHAANLPQRKCIVKLGTRDPFTLDVERIDPVQDVSDERVKRFKDYYYGKPIVRSRADVLSEINARFTTAVPRATADPAEPVQQQENKGATAEPQTRTDTSRPKRGKVFKHLPDSPPPLRRKRERRTRKTDSGDSAGN